MVVGAFNQVQQSLRWFVDNTGAIADWRATLAAGDELPPGAARSRRRRSRRRPHRATRGRRRTASRSTRSGSRPGTAASPSTRRASRSAPASACSSSASPARGAPASSSRSPGSGAAGSGRISVPPDADVAYLTQRPFLPSGSLRAALTSNGTAHATTSCAPRCERGGLDNLAGSLDHVGALGPGPRRRRAGAAGLRAAAARPTEVADLRRGPGPAGRRQPPDPPVDPDARARGERNHQHLAAPGADRLLRQGGGADHAAGARRSRICAGTGRCARRWRGSAASRAAALADFGREAGTAETRAAGRLANRYPPELRLFDRGGRRLDEVTFHPAYHELMRFGIGAGYAALAWDGAAGGHVAHAAMVYLEPGRARGLLPDDDELCRGPGAGGRSGGGRDLGAAAPQPALRRRGAPRCGEGGRDGRHGDDREAGRLGRARQQHPGRAGRRRLAALRPQVVLLGADVGRLPDPGAGAGRPQLLSGAALDARRRAQRAQAGAAEGQARQPGPTPRPRSSITAPRRRSSARKAPACAPSSRWCTTPGSTPRWRRPG